MEVDLLNRLTARCDGESPPSRHEVEVALELGFASLMSLEAQLRILEEQAPQTQRRLSGGAMTDRLMVQIDALRNALADLRSRTNLDHPPGLELGFVLPVKR